MDLQSALLVITNCMIAIVPLFDFLFNYTAQVKLWYQRVKNCHVLGSTTETANIAYETNTDPPTEEITVIYQPEVAPDVAELQPVSFFAGMAQAGKVSMPSACQPVAIYINSAQYLLRLL